MSMPFLTEVLEKLKEDKECRWEIREYSEKAKYCFRRERHIDRDVGGGVQRTGVSGVRGGVERTGVRDD